MQYTSQSQFVIQSHRYQNGTRTSVILDQSQEISSPKSVINRKKDVTGTIQPNFVYQSTSLNYYEAVEHWGVDENTNVDVFQETK